MQHEDGKDAEVDVDALLYQVKHISETYPPYVLGEKQMQKIEQAEAILQGMICTNAIAA